MKEEYDFSEAECARFYEPGVEFSFPIYLERDVEDFLIRLADEKGVNIQELVNEWLRANIQLVQSVQQPG